MARSRLAVGGTLVLDSEGTGEAPAIPMTGPQVDEPDRPKDQRVVVVHV